MRYSLEYHYGKAPAFKEYKDPFEEFYLNNTEEYLSQINYKLINIVNEILGIQTKISWSTDYDLIEGKTARLVNLVQQAGGSEYISGPAAQDYLEEDLFEKENIKVVWMDYSGYPEYNQLFPPFEHGVTVLDLIFNEGANAIKFMKSFN